MRRKSFVEPFSFWMEHGMYNSRCLSLVWSKLLNSIIFNTKKNYFFLLNHGENLNLFFVICFCIGVCLLLERTGESSLITKHSNGIFWHHGSKAVPQRNSDDSKQWPWPISCCMKFFSFALLYNLISSGKKFFCH
jgi:hypothetical protein